MISDQEVLELLTSNDLLALGDRAHYTRLRLHPEKIVSFTTASERNPAVTAEVALNGTADDLTGLAALRRTTGFLSFVVRAHKSLTATEYLKALAAARLYIGHIPNLEVDVERFDLKVCQLALRFGANDLGRSAAKYGEEQCRCLIREAGFLPKKRDSAYLIYSLM